MQPALDPGKRSNVQIHCSVRRIVPFDVRRRQRPAGHGARCDDESMKYIQSQVDMGADKLSAADKAMVATEFEAARKARDSQQIDECAVHLGNVVRTMNMDMSMMPKG